MTRASSVQIVQALANADTVAAVIAMTARYLRGWNDTERARLPENCRPDEIRDAEDVIWWADTFGTEYVSGELVTPELQEMYDVFQRAAGRLREIGQGG
jgi:hypothetical protein